VADALDDDPGVGGFRGFLSAHPGLSDGHFLGFPAWMHKTSENQPSP
jgi:hypothetical protein